MFVAIEKYIILCTLRESTKTDNNICHAVPNEGFGHVTPSKQEAECHHF